MSQNELKIQYVEREDREEKFILKIKPKELDPRFNDLTKEFSHKVHFRHKEQSINFYSKNFDDLKSFFENFLLKAAKHPIIPVNLDPNTMIFYGFDWDKENKLVYQNTNNKEADTSLKQQSGAATPTKKLRSPSLPGAQ